MVRAHRAQPDRMLHLWLLAVKSASLHARTSTARMLAILLSPVKSGLFRSADGEPPPRPVGRETAEPTRTVVPRNRCSKPARPGMVGRSSVTPGTSAHRRPSPRPSPARGRGSSRGTDRLAHPNALPPFVSPSPLTGEGQGEGDKAVPHPPLAPPIKGGEGKARGRGSGTVVGHEARRYETIVASQLVCDDAFHRRERRDRRERQDLRLRPVTPIHFSGVLCAFCGESCRAPAGRQAGEPRRYGPRAH